jgi:type IV pilus assembly protein PilO
MTLDELRSLDYNDPGGWPLPIKIVAIALLCVAVLGAGYWFDTRNQLVHLDSAQKKEIKLKSTYEAKMRKAVNLDAYKAQMKEMKRSFGAMLRQLPGKTEIADLLVDISQAGIANGLEFELFKPETEVPAEFYAELPIKIKVTGTYHQFGKFVSDVAALPRIVTLHDISIKPIKSKKGKAELVMDATAKTYRYLEEGETK